MEGGKMTKLLVIATETSKEVIAESLTPEQEKKIREICTPPLSPGSRDWAWDAMMRGEKVTLPTWTGESSLWYYEMLIPALPDSTATNPVRRLHVVNVNGWEE
jgi:hypothetical protein